MYNDGIEILESDKKSLVMGKDELNLAEFPIALLSETAPQGVRTLEYKDEIFDKGKHRLVKRKLTIEGSESYGLPTAKDDEVVLALIQLSKQRGFHSRKLEFTRYELITLLGWSNTGQSYARIEQSLHRWVSVTLHYEDAWWDKSEERWTSGAFHIIDDFEINDSREQSKQMSLLPSRINWNERVYKSFVEGHLKTIRYDVYVSLKHPTSKRMYRFLDKRFHYNNSLTFDLHDFAYEHIGLTRSYKDCGKIKEKLTPALEELEAIGFLKPMNREERYQRVGKGRWRIQVIRNQTATDNKTSIANEEQESQPLPLLANELIARGVSESTAVELCERYSAELVEAKIQDFDWLLSKKDRRIAKSPEGYLVTSIRGNYSTPKGSKSKAEMAQEEEVRRENERKAEDHRRHQKELAKRRIEEETAQEAAIDAYLLKLTDTEKAQLEAEIFDIIGHSRKPKKEFIDLLIRGRVSKRLGFRDA